MKPFLERLTSGIVLLLLIAAGIYCGGLLLILLLLFTSLCGIRELYQAISSDRTDMPRERYDSLAMCGYYITILIYGILAADMGYKAILFGLLAGVLATMIIYVRKYPYYRPVDFMSTIFGIVYVPVMLSSIYLIRCMDGGRWKAWLVFLCAWACDTFAYCVGSLIGKHKLAPVLSPKKSVEGAVGGVAGAMLLCGIFGYCFMNFGSGLEGMSDRVSSSTSLIMLFVFIGLIGSVFSQIGDLCASAIKRHYEIKDYGKIIPGHGGILDRFDSCIVTAPLVLIVLSLLG